MSLLKFYTNSASSIKFGSLTLLWEISSDLQRLPWVLARWEELWDRFTKELYSFWLLPCLFWLISFCFDYGGKPFWKMSSKLWPQLALSFIARELNISFSLSSILKGNGIPLWFINVDCFYAENSVMFSYDLIILFLERYVVGVTSRYGVPLRPPILFVLLPFFLFPRCLRVLLGNYSSNALSYNVYFLVHNVLNSSTTWLGSFLL